MAEEHKDDQLSMQKLKSYPPRSGSSSSGQLALTLAWALRTFMTEALEMLKFDLSLQLKTPGKVVKSCYSC